VEASIGFMKEIPIIQYLPLTRARASLKVFKKLDFNNVHVIFDLEDSAQDPFSRNNTNLLKKVARDGLIEIFSKINWRPKSKIYIRINSDKSTYYDEDIKAILKVLKLNTHIEGIFLPKVESYNQIQKLYYLLPSDIKIDIVPMIETKNGLNNLQKILELDCDKNIFNKVHYGHFDYSLDAGCWPFSNPENKEFWKIVGFIVETVKKYGKLYVHTPFPFSDNVDLFWGSNLYLSRLVPGTEIWICTLNMELSLTKYRESSLVFVDLEYKESDLISSAIKITNKYIEGKANKRSFSVFNSQFIPPHQYFAAKKYLKSLE
jgi:citrate lyase beta subunit